MAQVLLIDDDPGTLSGFGMILRLAGHDVLTAECGLQGLELLRRHNVDVVLSDLRLPDISGLDLLRDLRRAHIDVSCALVSGFGTARDAVAALRLGAVDFLEKPLSEDDLLRTVELALVNGERAQASCMAPDAPAGPAPLAAPSAGAVTAPLPKPQIGAPPGRHRAHAAARWAAVLAPVIDAPVDPRTVTAWSRRVYVSPGALRNWCRMAGISPRRSLVFARLLRAVCLSDNGRHRPENLLDVVDRRTLNGLLRFAGLGPALEFPRDIDEFIERQQLIRDADALREVCAAVREYQEARRAGSDGKDENADDSSQVAPSPWMLTSRKDD